jgi:hypothetical protein
MENRRLNPTNVVLQIVVLLLAGLALLWLYNIDSNWASPWLASMAGWFGRTTWLWTTLIILFVLLLVQILLLMPWWRTVNEEEFTFVKDTETSAPVTLGCKSCGTVFQKFQLELEGAEEKHLRCPNCARAGDLTGKLQGTTAQRACEFCNHSYVSYKERSECPSCHTVNS